MAVPNVLVAVQRFLAADTQLTALLGSSTAFPTWIFRREVHENVQGSGKCALILGGAGSWTSRNIHNTANFPRLQVEVFADPDRDITSGNAALASSGEDKAWVIAARVDKLLHTTPSGRVQWWGGLTVDDSIRVIGCQSQGDPTLTDVPDGDGLVDIVMSYGLSIG